MLFMLMIPLLLFKIGSSETFSMGSSPHIHPSQYDLSYTILDGGAARVQLKEMDRVKNKKLLTYIIDG